MYLKTLSVYCKLSRRHTRTKRCTASFSHVIKMFAFIIIVCKLKCKIRFYKYFVSNERKIYKPFGQKIQRLLGKILPSKQIDRKLSAIWQQI